jgi:hypothetical protein
MFFTIILVHRKKDFLKIQEYIHEGANLKGTVARKSWRDECMGH